MASDELADKLEIIEREKYKKQWGKDFYSDYSPAMKFIDEALKWIKPRKSSSFADFGCGTGRASQHLADLGYKVTAYDIADNTCKEFTGNFIEGCLWSLTDSKKYKYAICCDVMEHIPPKMVWSVLRNIRDRVEKEAFFQIARFEDKDGLHLCLRDPDWWAQSFDRHFTRVEWVISEKYLLCRAIK